ncbi:hypothetical protein GCM10010250_69510 [Streptomyces althioticus]|nr:hypothetical protein GCM10010250_69510 [Streptomyces althioticus]
MNALPPRHPLGLTTSQEKGPVYWLDTRLDDGGTCTYGIGGGQPVICQLAAE